tara:strand:- start:30 stop:347 length:318 start_codon:yes stop_codon:yes gene_type:complete
MIVTQHLIDRIKLRTDINVDSFISEVFSKRDEIEKLDINSPNLSKHPQVKGKLRRNPTQIFWVIDWLGYYIVEGDKNLITMFPIKKFGKIEGGVHKVKKYLHHHT